MPTAKTFILRELLYPQNKIVLTVTPNMLIFSRYVMGRPNWEGEQAILDVRHIEYRGFSWKIQGLAHSIIGMRNKELVRS